MADPAVVRQIGRLGFQREDPIDRGVQLRRIELTRRCGGKNELAGGGVEFAVTHAEGISREHLGRVAIDDAQMMQRMSRGMNELERAPAHLDPLPILYRADAFRWDGHDVAVLLEKSGLAVYRFGGGDQNGGVNQVGGATRVHQHTRARQRRRQTAAPPAWSRWM